MASVCEQRITLFLFKSILILYFHLPVELSSGLLATISNLNVARIQPILHTFYTPSSSHLDFIALILSGIKTSRRWRFGLWHHAVMWIGTDVSGKSYTSFFREEITFTLNTGTGFLEISTKPYSVRSQTLVHNRTPVISFVYTCT